LERESQIADAGEQPVQLRLVDDFADQLGGARVGHERHAVEGGGEALAEALAHCDSDAEGRFHLE
jgi:hypothetical protein